jgi:hypothetical protein
MPVDTRLDPAAGDLDHVADGQRGQRTRLGGFDERFGQRVQGVPLDSRRQSECPVSIDAAGMPRLDPHQLRPADGDRYRLV